MPLSDAITTKPTFSRLGFGVTGPHASAATPRGATVSLIRRAVELGVTVFDTAPVYGAGEAERRLGAALRGLDADRLFICTKAGWQGGPDGGRSRDFSPDAIEASLHASLARLDRPGVDALFLHGPDPSDLTPVLLERLQSMRQSGLYRFLGICGRGVEIDAALDTGGFHIVMAPLHAGLEPADFARLARAHETGLGVIAIETMTGVKRGPRFPQTADLWYAARRLKQAIDGQTAPQSPKSPAEALAWALARPEADCVLSLTTRRSHLGANARAAGLDPLQRDA